MFTPDPPRVLMVIEQQDGTCYMAFWPAASEVVLDHHEPHTSHYHLEAKVDGWARSEQERPRRHITPESPALPKGNP